MSSVQAEKSLQSVRAWNVWVGGALLLASLPIIWLSSARLWGDAETRLFPLGLLALAGFMTFMLLRERATQPSTTPRLSLAVSILVLAAVLNSCAIWFVSLPLAIAAAGLMVGAWGLGASDRYWPRVFALTALCLVTLDGFGIAQSASWLRLFGAWMTSGALDALQIVHLRNGNLLELDGLTLYSERLCGGNVDSLYGLLLVATVYLMLSHRGLLISLKALLSVPVWIVLRDFLLLLTISLSHHYYGRDLSSGWDFLLLRLALDGWILFSAWLHVRLMARFTEPIPPSDAEFGPIFSALNKAGCWPQTDPFENMEPEDPDEARHFRKLQAQRAEYEAQRPRVDWTASPSIGWLVRIGAIAFLLSGLSFGVLLAVGKIRANFFGPSLNSRTSESLSQFELQPDPAGIGAIKGVDSQSADDQVERIWKGKLEKQEYTLHLHYPSPGVETAVRARESIGWAEIDRNEFSYLEFPSLVGVRTELANELGGVAYIWAVTLDENFRCMEPSISSGTLAPGIGVTIPGRTAAEVWSAEDSAVSAPVLMQLFVDSGDELSRAEIQAFEKVIAAAFRQLSPGQP